jgi:proteasome accessory factor C
MGKKFSAPLERTARLLDLVPYISSHQGISVKELASVFDVTQPQMINDLTTLWMCGLPGYTPLELMDLDFDSGFVTISNAPTLSKPRTISFDEGVALVLGLDLMKSSISTDRADLLESIDALSKRLTLLINLPSALSATATVNLRISTSISEAIKKRTGLSIQYHSMYRDEVTVRSIIPFEIIANNGYSYLSAYCFNAKDFRQFRVDRIQSAEPTDVGTQEIASKRYESAITSTIKVLSPSRDIVERFNQSQLSAGSEFTYDSFSQQWMERSILASGSGAELISPQEIRRSIAETAQSMLDRYKAG